MEKKVIITLPKRKVVENIQFNVENGKLKVTYDLEDEFKPKDGDFVVDYDGDVFIAKNPDNGCACGCYVGYSKILGFKFSIISWARPKRYSTLQEKKAFLDRLKNECGKRWNPETKQIDDIRWRAEENELYYYLIVGNPTIVKNIADMRLLFDDVRYESGNYFRTYEAAKNVADQIKEIFKNSKAE